GNSSSGKMGVAIAKAFARQGAGVELIMGPAGLDTRFPEIHTTHINTAAEMDAMCQKAFPDVDIAVMAAAIADFTPAKPAAEKIKKATGPEAIPLKPTNDILASLGKVKKQGQLLIGFALETENELANAQKKLRKKNLDMIVLNSLKDKGAGFGTDTNKITLLTRNDAPQSFPLKTKDAVALDILSAIKSLMEG
ncbi:Phosphopantothenoylcysteine decarboxylase / Phosphopantothenoylcysteine synthetase, partial [hydrothermal vent metagenome]